METLPSEILALLQEHKLDIAAEKLRKRVVETLTLNDYSAAVTALVTLGSIESKLSQNSGLPSLELALTVADQAHNDSLKAEVLYRRILTLQAQGNDTDVFQAIDEALAWAHRTKVQQWVARFLQLRLFLNFKRIRGKQDFIVSVHEVVQAYRVAQDVNGQLNTLVTFAVLMAPQDPSSATVLLDEAEMFLDTVEPNLLERPSQSTLIQIPAFGPLHIHQTPQVDDVEKQWRAYISQQREQITKMYSRTER